MAASGRRESFSALARPPTSTSTFTAGCWTACTGVALTGAPALVEVSEPTDEALQAVLHKMISRTMRLLTRRGCWSDCTTHLVMSRRSLCSGWQRMQLVWSLLPSRPCSRG